MKSGGLCIGTMQRCICFVVDGAESELGILDLIQVGLSLLMCT